MSGPGRKPESVGEREWFLSVCFLPGKKTHHQWAQIFVVETSQISLSSNIATVNQSGQQQAAGWQQVPADGSSGWRGPLFLSRGLTRVQQKHQELEPAAPRQFTRANWFYHICRTPYIHFHCIWVLPTDQQWPIILLFLININLSSLPWDIITKNSFKTIHV